MPEAAGITGIINWIGPRPFFGTIPSLVIPKSRCGSIPNPTGPFLLLSLPFPSFPKFQTQLEKRDTPSLPKECSPILSNFPPSPYPRRASRGFFGRNCGKIPQESAGLGCGSLFPPRRRLAELLPPGKASKAPGGAGILHPAGWAAAPLIPEKQKSWKSLENSAPQKKPGLFPVGGNRESLGAKIPFDPSKAPQSANSGPAKPGFGNLGIFCFLWEQQITSRGFNSRPQSSILPREETWNCQICLG